MQTFLPYSSFSKSAAVLDYRRLGKQRVECKQLLSALGYEIVDKVLVPIPADRPKKAGWVNHPATKMWTGYHDALAEYMTFMILHWKERGYNNTMPYLDPLVARTHQNPPWLGDERVHASHRSNLLRKDAEHYGKWGWVESPDLPYQWPMIDNDGTYYLRTI